MKEGKAFFSIHNDVSLNVEGTSAFFLDHPKSVMSRLVIHTKSSPIECLKIVELNYYDQQFHDRVGLILIFNEEGEAFEKIRTDDFDETKQSLE